MLQEVLVAILRVLVASQSAGMAANWPSAGTGGSSVGRVCPEQTAPADYGNGTGRDVQAVQTR